MVMQYIQCCGGSSLVYETMLLPMEVYYSDAYQLFIMASCVEQIDYCIVSSSRLEQLGYMYE